MESLIRELLDTPFSPYRWSDVRATLKKENIRVEVQKGALAIAGSFTVDNVASELRGPCFLLSTKPTVAIFRNRHRRKHASSTRVPT